MPVYTGVNSVARNVKDISVGVNGVARKVIGGWVGVGGVAREFWGAKPPGSVWTIRQSAADNLWYSVCYGNGMFVAVANTGTGNRVMTSPNGIDWTARNAAADNSWRSVCYGNGMFVAVANEALVTG